MVKFKIIAAMAENRALGKNNALLFEVKEDMRHFAQKTKGSAVIMGRKTWESLPEAYKPLPARLNIVLTEDAKYVLPSGVLKAGTLDQALALAENAKEKYPDTFIIGGAKLYSEAIMRPECDEILLTVIHAQAEADAFFPEIPNEFILSKEEILTPATADLQATLKIYSKDSS